uniref:Protein rolling stone-like isoform X2 n=1 Tax=Crassostrea virginica TaxID=6565 RepID=A0A8B8B3D8_CRAVI|nr:protein rolling stone-like isoform X2 [Crassostrea virginica]
MSTQMEPISVEIDVYMYVIVSEAEMFEVNARDSRRQSKHRKNIMAKRENRCLQSCQQQWRLSSFGFQHDQPLDFVTFQWGNLRLYILWSLSWAVFHVLVLALQPYFFREVLPNWKWFIYLTNWSYIVLAVYGIVEATAAIFVNVCREEIINRDSTVLPWYLRIQWSFYYLSTTSAITVTLLFILNIEEETDTNSILKHYINSLFVVLNLLLTKKPYRILHFYIPVIFSVIYILFSLVYQKGFNQNAIYSALDWNNVPNVFLYVFGLPLVFVPLLTLLLYTITVIRDAIGNLCEKNIGQTDRPVAID